MRPRNEANVIAERIAVLENRLERFCRSETERERTRAELSELREKLSRF